MASAIVSAARPKLQFWRTVVRTAWRDTRGMVAQHSAKTLLRNAALLLVAVGLSYWFQAELVQRGLISSDHPTVLVVRIICGLIALVAVFAAVFVLEVLFLAPRALWREAKGEIAVLSATIAVLEQALTPRISFGRIARDDRESEGVGKSSELYTIEVVNEGNTMLENCAVTVRRVTFGGRRKPIELNGALTTVTRDHDGRFVWFGLRPGVPKQLLLVTRDVSDVPDRSPHLIRNEVINLPLERGQSGTIELVAGCEIGQPTTLTIGWAVAHSTYDLTLEKGIENEQSDVVFQVAAGPLDLVHEMRQPCVDRTKTRAGGVEAELTGKPAASAAVHRLQPPRSTALSQPTASR